MTGILERNAENIEPELTSSPTPVPLSGLPQSPNAPASRSVRISLVIICFLLTLQFAQAAQQILVPLLLAMFFRTLLIPVIRSAQARAKIPRWLSSTIIMLTLFVGLATIVVSYSGLISKWFDELPGRIQEIHQRTMPLKRSLHRVSETAESIAKIAEVSTSPQRSVSVASGSLLVSVITESGEALASFALFFLLLFFMLIYGDQLVNDMVRFFSPHEERANQLLETISEAEHQVSVYLITVCSINIVLALVEFLALSLLGMPNALLWGLVAGFLNFIPYAGALVGAAALGLTALFTFPLSQALTVTAVFYGITVIEGSFITPLILGLKLVLNPVLVLAWVVLWSWLWGIAGAFLAVPLLVTAKLAVEHLHDPAGSFKRIFLST